MHRHAGFTGIVVRRLQGQHSRIAGRLVRPSSEGLTILKVGMSKEEEAILMAGGHDERRCPRAESSSLTRLRTGVGRHLSLPRFPGQRGRGVPHG